MRKPSLPLLAWVVLALALVGLLPFAISGYLIGASRAAMVDQVQTTHLIAARAMADRVASTLELLTAVGLSAARNPNLYLDPASEAAQEILAGLPQARSEILAAGLYWFLNGRRPPAVLVRPAPGALELRPRARGTARLRS